MNKTKISKCAFCDLSEMGNRIVFKNDLVVAFPTRTPIVPGHILICPVRHAKKLEELTPNELMALLDLRIKIKNALKKTLGAQGFHYAWNEEKIGGQSVPHFHLHVVPRKKGDAGITEYEPRKFLYRPGSRENKPDEELCDIAKQVAERLKD
jgi:diadenosine tetraphosphate (Ap4A) HIT family hydrolase